MGIALVRLLKPLEFYKEKYGTAFTEYKKCISNGKATQSWTRWCWFCKYKIDMEPGERYK
jgi:amidophosphoribosyltransferase